MHVCVYVWGGGGLTLVEEEQGPVGLGQLRRGAEYLPCLHQREAKDRPACISARLKAPLHPEPNSAAHPSMTARGDRPSLRVGDPSIASRPPSACLDDRTHARGAQYRPPPDGPAWCACACVPVCLCACGWAWVGGCGWVGGWVGVGLCVCVGGGGAGAHVRAGD